VRAAAAPEPRWRRHLVWGAVAVAYLTVSPFFAKLNNPNENVRVWATRALAHHGTLAIDPVIAEWGNTGDRAVHEGRRYSSKAPGTSLLGVPVHFVHDRLVRLATGASPSQRASTFVLRIATVVLPLLVFLLVFARRVEAQTGSPFARDLLTLGLGLGTMFYPYGLTFVGHAQSAALLFLGFLTVIPGPGGLGTSYDAPPGRLLIGGGLTGLAVVFEYQALLAALVVAVFALVTLRRRAGWFALGALAAALVLGAYHLAVFGSPLTFPYAHLDDEGFRQFHHSQGFLGLGRPRALVLEAALFHVDYGLLVFSPFLAVGLVVALVSFVRRPTAAAGRQHAAVLAVTVALLVFLAGMANWRGGWCAGGPRYIAGVVPFLCYALALEWQALFAPRPWARAGLAALVLVAVFLCVLSGAMFPHFPVQLDNPVFDLAVPLLRRGYAPWGLGTLLGLPGAAALVPVLLAALVAVGGTLASAPRPRALTAGAAVGLALVLLLALGNHGRRPSRIEDQAVEFVRGVWEPER
jgi:hypothetical protein